MNHASRDDAPRRRLPRVAALGGLVIAMACVTHVRAGQEAPPTAREVAWKIQAALGGDWAEGVVDGFKAGDPDTPVTGVAVAMMPTMEVLRRAAAMHAPLRVPDPVVAALVRNLGLADALVTPGGNVVRVAAVSLRALADRMRMALHDSTLRVVGDPAQMVRTIAFLPGAGGFDMHRAAQGSDGVDALVIGETLEWETVPWVADAVSQGRPRALIILGHVVSEQGGSEELANWLRPLLPGLPVHFVATPNPFW